MSGKRGDAKPDDNQGLEKPSRARKVIEELKAQAPLKVVLARNVAAARKEAALARQEEAARQGAALARQGAALARQEVALAPQEEAARQEEAGTDGEAPPAAGEQPVDLWKLADLCTPWCVHVAATLRIAEHIAAGKDTIEALAAAAGCDSSVLHAVLGHLVSKGLFEEPAPGRFALNEAARALLDPVTQMSLDLEGIGGRMAYAWGTLLPYVRTGVPAYHEVAGLPFWEDLDAHPRIAAQFDTLIGPAGHGAPDPYFEITGGWDSVRTVADVGGGTGAMLAEILRAHPHLEGILVDQPKTVRRSAEIFAEAGVTGRVKAVGQNFFHSLPPGADMYVLRGIINDWPDREAAAVLTRCAEAARPGNGRVVVLKSVMPDDAPRDLFIEMVLLAGKPRTVSEFRALARGAGLEVVAAGQQVRPDGQPGYFVTECRPV